MKRQTQILLLAIALLAALVIYSPRTRAVQQINGTVIAQQSQRYDSAILCQHNHTTSTTITITPPAGQYVYIVGLDIMNAGDNVGVTGAAPTFITTTGITGSPQYMAASGTGAGAAVSNSSYQFGPGGLKSSTPGANVTFVGPAFATHQTLSMNVWYYFGL